MSNCHLVILKKPYLDAIIAGRKTIEFRPTMTRRAPFGQISTGDKLFLKQSSGPVVATAEVSKFKAFENLTASKIDGIKRRYNQYILGSEEYWHSRAGCRFALLVWLKNVRNIEPVKINKRDYRAWVVLTADEDFGLPAFAHSRQVLGN